MYFTPRLCDGDGGTGKARLPNAVDVIAGSPTPTGACLVHFSRIMVSQWVILYLGLCQKNRRKNSGKRTARVLFDDFGLTRIIGLRSVASSVAALGGQFSSISQKPINDINKGKGKRLGSDRYPLTGIAASTPEQGGKSKLQYRARWLLL